jgi:hypothetical protein
MDVKTKDGTTRLPQRALDRIDEIVDSLPLLTPAQLADLSLIIYGYGS